MMQSYFGFGRETWQNPPIDFFSGIQGLPGLMKIDNAGRGVKYYRLFCTFYLSS